MIFDPLCPIANHVERHYNIFFQDNYTQDSLWSYVICINIYRIIHLKRAVNFDQLLTHDMVDQRTTEPGSPQKSVAWHQRLAPECVSGFETGEDDLIEPYAASTYIYIHTYIYIYLDRYCLYIMYIYIYVITKISSARRVEHHVKRWWICG